jgi:ribosomal protein S3
VADDATIPGVGDGAAPVRGRRRDAGARAEAACAIARPSDRRRVIAAVARAGCVLGEGGLGVDDVTRTLRKFSSSVN